jgi:hypothetical protein
MATLQELKDRLEGAEDVDATYRTWQDEEGSLANGAWDEAPLFLEVAETLLQSGSSLLADEVSAAGMERARQAKSSNDPEIHAIAAVYARATLAAGRTHDAFSAAALVAGGPAPGSVAVITGRDDYAAWGAQVPFQQAWEASETGLMAMPRGAEGEFQHSCMGTMTMTMNGVTKNSLQTEGNELLISEEDVATLKEKLGDNLAGAALSSPYADPRVAFGAVLAKARRDEVTRISEGLGFAVVQAFEQASAAPVSALFGGSSHSVRAFKQALHGRRNDYGIAVNESWEAALATTLVDGVTVRIDRSGESPFGADGLVLACSHGQVTFHVAMSDEGALGVEDPPQADAAPEPAPEINLPERVEADDVDESTELDVSPKSKGVAMALCLIAGFTGAHRFYLGKFGTGALQLFTFGGCGLWVPVDLILLALGKMTDSEGRPVV